MYEGILGIKKPIFGLDIGYQTLKVAQVKGRGSSCHLFGCAEIPIPTGVLTKDGVGKKDEIAGLIKQAMAQAKPHPINAKIISSALPESLVFTKTIDMPKMTIDEINKNIPYQANEFFPTPVEDTYMDWQIVGTLPNSAKIEVLVVAAPKTLVNSLIEMAKIAGLELLSLETKPVANTRAVIFPQDRNPYLILDIGAKVSGLTCYDQGTIKLTSTIALGGDEIKKDPQKSLEALASEIIHLVKYYQNRIGQAQVFQKIILVGGGSNIPEVKGLENLTKIKTEVSMPQMRTKTYDPKFATAIGLAKKDI